MISDVFRLCGFLAFVLASACANIEGGAQDGDATARAVEKASTASSAAARIEADVRYLADDKREGREAGSQGYQDAAEYVAARMAAIGLEPAGDDGWFQQVPLRSNTPQPEASQFSITNSNGETETLVSLEDFRMFPSVDRTEVDISAPVAFVGYGVHAPAEGHDDYAGVDVDGKIIAYFGGAPDSFDSEKRAHYNSRGEKFKVAAERGAIGAIGLFSSASEKRFPWERIVANPTAKRMTWVHPDGRTEVSGGGIAGVATLHVSKSELLFEGAEKSFADVRAEADAEGVSPKGFDLAVSVTMKGVQKAEIVNSPNVVGLIPGSDPALKDEYIVLTAHLDHIGVNETKVKNGEDGINNGAMDNALGVATMLEAASRIKAEAPARSVLIIALTGEEKGLLGADYFAHYPTVAKQNLAANVNLDMPVVLHEFTDVIAFGAERSSIGPITAKAASKMGITLSPDPIPEQGLFTRSDHYRFVEQGVPSVFMVVGFANGGEQAINDFLKNHYHKPSDDPDLPIRYKDAARFAEVNYMIAVDLANAEERPHWNEGDFFGDLFGGE